MWSWARIPKAIDRMNEKCRQNYVGTSLSVDVAMFLVLLFQYNTCHIQYFSDAKIRASQFLGVSCLGFTCAAVVVNIVCKCVHNVA